MSPPLLPQDITMTETEETVLAKLVQDRIGQDFEGECHLTEHEARRVIAALSRAPEAGREGAAERLAIVAEKPAHLIRWGEGDRLDLQSVLAALSPPSTGGEGEAARRAFEMAVKIIRELGNSMSPGGLAETIERNTGSLTIKVLSKLKENGLSREGLGGLAASNERMRKVLEDFLSVAKAQGLNLGPIIADAEDALLGGLAQSLPSGDAQERSPVLPLSDGGQDIGSIIVLLETGLNASDTKVVRACIAAALDFARNDQEALAEGRLWADPPTGESA